MILLGVALTSPLLARGVRERERERERQRERERERAQP